MTHVSVQKIRTLVATCMLVAAITAVSCGSSEVVANDQATVEVTDSSTPASTRPSFERPGPALDITGVDGWINSEPLSIQQELDQNNVVLIDFWTYTCVNCLRTIPFLQEWQEKYSEHGLVIIGVHSPEFEFEKVRANVEQAVVQEGVSWPVALDTNMQTWRVFGNRFWPAKYLLTPAKGLTYSHFGEGSYIETEQEIRDALEAAGRDITGIPVGTVDNAERDRDAKTMTREIYGGYVRSYHPQGLYAGDDEYYISPDSTRFYEDEQDYEPQQFFLQGEWTNGAEAIVHARRTEIPEDFIALLMQARSANVVVEPQSTEVFRVYVTLDDQPLSMADAGDDIQFDKDGSSYFIVDSPRMYRVVEQQEFQPRVLKISSTSDAFAVFAFTFGIYDGGF
jgi:thiol-disulfide isomerase/thioredoxin